MDDTQLTEDQILQQAMQQESANTEVSGKDFASEDAALLEEMALQEKYGGKPVQAGLAGAARGLTFGLSDVIGTKSGIVAPETLKGLKEANVPVSVGSEIAGVVGGALATGGTGLAARGAGAATRAVTAAGAAAEAAAAAKLGQTAGLVARGVAEGAVTGVGMAASDAALENKPLTAESLAANVTMGALLGGVLTPAVAGVGKVSSSTVEKAKKLVGKGEKFKTQMLQPFTDTFESGVGLVETTPARRAAFKEAIKGDESVLQDVLVKTAPEENISFSELNKRNKKLITETADEIDSLSTKLDNARIANGVEIRKSEVYQPILNKIKMEKAELMQNPAANSAKLAALEKINEDVTARSVSEIPETFADLQAYKRSFYDIGYKNGTALENYKANIAQRIAGELRERTLEQAQKFGVGETQQLVERFVKANKEYGVRKAIEDGLALKAELQPNAKNLIFNPIKTAAEGTANWQRWRTVRNQQLKAIEAVDTGISGGLNAFFKLATKKVSAKPAMIYALNKSAMAKDPETDKQPKTELEAFKNVSKSISELKADNEKLIDLLAKRTGQYGPVDPELAHALQANMLAALMLLDAKLPRPATQQGLFSREYRPTSMELAKFKRYVQIVDSPLSVIDELKNGTITREHVEALQTVYPEIYRKVQQQAIDFIAENPKLSYERKLQIGILLNVPADPSMTGKSIMDLQQSIVGAQLEQQAQQQQSGQVRAKGMDTVDISGRAATGVQKLQSE